METNRCWAEGQNLNKKTYLSKFIIEKYSQYLTVNQKTKQKHKIYIWKKKIETKHTHTYIRIETKVMDLVLGNQIPIKRSRHKCNGDDLFNYKSNYKI